MTNEKYTNMGMGNCTHIITSPSIVAADSSSTSGWKQISTMPLSASKSGGWSRFASGLGCTPNKSCMDAVASNELEELSLCNRKNKKHKYTPLQNGK